MINCEVDTVTGEVMHNLIDLDLPGPVPLELTRRYVSAHRIRGLLGWGWTHNFAPSATWNASGLTKHNPLDGDSSIPADKCDGHQGPSVQLLLRHQDDDAARRIRASSRAPWPEVRGDQLVAAYPDESQEIYVAGDVAQRWRLAQRSDGGGRWLRYGYERGRLTTIERFDRLRVAFEYSLGDLLTGFAVFASPAAGEAALEVRYEYDRHDDLVAFRDAHGPPWRYEYVDHLLVRSVDYCQNGRNYLYDRQRRCVRTWHDGNRLVRTFRFDTLGHHCLISDSYGAQTLLVCTATGIPVTHIDPRGQITQRILDNRGALLATVQADGSVQSGYLFDPETNVLSEQTARGGVWRRQLDGRGRLVAVTSPSGRVQKFAYDDRGRYTQIVKWNGGVLRFQYDERDTRTTLVDPLGYEVVREASPDGHEVRVFDRFGMLFQQWFDALSNLVRHVDAGGRETRYTYRAVDCPAEVTEPGGATDRYVYDAALQMVAHTDPLGRVRRYEYDSSGNVIATVDPLGGRIRYVYNLEDDLLRVVNEKGEALEIGRDDLRREVQARYFDGKVVRYELDQLGRRTAIIDGAGGRTELSYHERREIQGRVFPDGASELYDLNPDGDYVAIRFTPPPGSSEESRSAEFVYDDNSNLVAETHNGRTIEYPRNLAGKVLAVRDSLGDETQFQRGDRYQIDTIIDLGREYHFRRLRTGELTELRFPNGLRQEFAYDDAGRVLERRMLSRDDRLLSWRRYAYDGGTQLLEMEDWHWGHFRYRYDLLGRLTAVARGDGAVLESYRYDAASNLVDCPLLPDCAVAPGNRLTAAGDEQFEYDANGNLVVRREPSHQWRYDWDRDQQLSAVWRDGALVGSYQYDLLNRRVRKTTAEQSIDFLYDTYALRAEIFADGTRNHYLSLSGLPVPIALCDRTGRFFFFSIDQIGTPVEVFDEAGELALAVRSQAFGGARQEYRPTGSDVGFPFGFMGQYFDAESGLFYNHFRYYDPRLGRYVSQDPLETYAGMNFYIYPANPNNSADPLGLMPSFTCPKHWGPCQCWYARQKVAAVNDAPATRRKKVCSSKCRANAQKTDFEGKKCGYGSAGVGRAVDHFHELQAGGPDRCCRNLRAVEEGFNNELGRAMTKTLKGIDYGKTIGKISMSGCTGKGECSEEGKKNVAKPPPDADACEDDKPLNCTCD